LGAALDRLLAQSADSPAHEIIVVDNNSSDDTRRVAERSANSTGRRVHYVFEPRQGLSHARNAGIAAARADLIAFTDDDVRVADDWVGVIKRTFDAHAEADCLGGRTLPIWPSAPPSWLTRRHWVGPLALQDYGDQPFTVDARRPVCLAGANFAFRKEVFARLGAFSPDFERSEDTEIMLRLWRGGGRAVYVPDMMAFAAVQTERLTKRYHRQWHANIGRCNARMQLAEFIAADGSLRSEAPPFARLAGVPWFAVRQLATEALEWCKATARRSESEAFWHETQARTLVGYMRESRARFLGRSSGWS
jgi:glycosyltransferase involved in cell wall biosynthesis